MGRRTVSTTYLMPIKSDGTVLEESAAGLAELGRGAVTLEASTVYYFMLDGADATVLSAHLQWDAAIILTSVKIEDCNFPPKDVDDHSDTAGHWIEEDPTTAFVGTVGAGVTVTDGVVAVAGGAAGGCMFHVSDTGARRTRVRVEVAGTGGEVRLATHAKE